VEACSAALVERLRASGAHEVIRLRPGETLLQAVEASAPDIIIVDIARHYRRHGTTRSRSMVSAG
jgi:hypothetical protein